MLAFEPLGFLTPTPVRRIGYADAVAFGELHARVYAEHGFALVPVAPDRPGRRAAAVAAVLDTR